MVQLSTFSIYHIGNEIESTFATAKTQVPDLPVCKPIVQNGIIRIVR